MYLDMFIRELFIIIAIMFLDKEDRFKFVMKELCVHKSYRYLLMLLFQ